MNDLIKGGVGAVLGGLAGAGLAVAAVLAIEASMPPVSGASTKGMSDYEACLYNKKTGEPGSAWAGG